MYNPAEMANASTANAIHPPRNDTALNMKPILLLLLLLLLLVEDVVDE